MARLRRLRPQRAEPARGDAAGAQVCGVRRPQPDLGDAGRPRQAQRAAGAAMTRRRRGRAPRSTSWTDASTSAPVRIGRGAGGGHRRRHRLRQPRYRRRPARRADQRSPISTACRWPARSAQPARRRQRSRQTRHLRGQRPHDHADDRRSSCAESRGALPRCGHAQPDDMRAGRVRRWPFSPALARRRRRAEGLPVRHASIAIPAS